MSRTQKLVNLQVLIDCEENFDIQNLGVCVVEQTGPSYVPPEKGFIDDDLLFLPKTSYCEIVEYIEIVEIKELYEGGGYRS